MARWQLGMKFLDCGRLLLILILHLTHGQYQYANNKNERSPVILVPGYAGNRLEAKLNKPYHLTLTNLFCSRYTKDFYLLYQDVMQFLPFTIQCWVDNARLVYNNRTRTTSSPQGVKVRAPGFGKTWSTETLGPDINVPFLGALVNKFHSYFDHMVTRLVKMGYTRNVDLKGAPYDFRKAPNELTEYYFALKNMIEETFRKSGRPVTFICHSMGCLVMLYFFNHQTQQWKDVHVKKFITLAGVWGGSVPSLNAFISGDNLGIPLILKNKMWEQQSTNPGLVYMTPSYVVWGKRDVLVEIDDKNYALENIQELFKDIGQPEGWEMYKDTYNLTQALVAPGVEVHCIHGSNVSTIERAAVRYHAAGDTFRICQLGFLERTFYRRKIVANESKSSDPEHLNNIRSGTARDQIIVKRRMFDFLENDFVYGDGDGRVNARSLEACLRFTNDQKQAVYNLKLPGVDHSEIRKADAVLNYIEKVL